MAAFSVRTRQAAVLMDGIHTEVFCSCYQDRIFVIVSQFEKMGNLVSFCQLLNFDWSDTKTLMGSDEEIWHVYAKQIGALICENSNKPLLVGIALKKHSPQTLQQILKLLQLNRVW
ncbi:PREDICTED: proteasome assembly chaperone 3-like [Acropora digitifera]|uniref:proteasome assembly chaperone 3-like n=1 Tax=Acropora digitifera TaxID=70779 RepID=UPI00077A34BF|nr:PREDICTED: proteasome assembly chaperone 3-like [Acropora digitifera]